MELVEAVSVTACQRFLGDGRSNLSVVGPEGSGEVVYHVCVRTLWVQGQHLQMKQLCGLLAQISVLSKSESSDLTEITHFIHLKIQEFRKAVRKENIY